MNECGRIAQVVLKHAREAFGSQRQCDAEWRDLNFLGAPDFNAAVREYDAFAAAITSLGADVTWLPGDARTGLDSIYVRDASLVSPLGTIACAMGKPQRASEPSVQREVCEARGIAVAGAIAPPATGAGDMPSPPRIEGGDVVWFDRDTVAVGHGYRTNAAGISQFGHLLPSVDVVTVPLPHYKGPSDVFHLMSILSPVDRDLAVVYSPLMPVPFREWLIARGMTLVEVPGDEFDSMGANVLAIAPRRCVMLEGNPKTRAALERAGASVVTYEGRNISLLGGGGPTCLTRPLRRE